MCIDNYRYMKSNNCIWRKNICCLYGREKEGRGSRKEVEGYWNVGGGGKSTWEQV